MGLIFSTNVLAVQRRGSRLNAQIGLDGGYEIIGDGRQVIDTAGTREQLITTATPCALVTVCASQDSRGVIAVGTSTVVAARATRRGIGLVSNDCIDVKTDDVSNVYVDSTISGEAAEYIYYEYF